MRTINTTINKKNRTDIRQLLTEAVAATPPPKPRPESPQPSSSNSPVPECHFTVIPFSSKRFIAVACQWDCHWLPNGLPAGYQIFLLFQFLF